MKVNREFRCSACHAVFPRERNLRRHPCRRVVPLLSLRLPPPPPKSDLSQPLPPPPLMSIRLATPPAPQSQQHQARQDPLPTPPPPPASPSTFLPSPLRPPPSASDSLSPSPDIHLSPAELLPEPRGCSPVPPSPALSPMPSKFCQPQTRDVAIQVNGEWDRRSRARRRIFEDTRHIGHLRPVPPIGPEVQDAPKDISLRINLKRQRRLCDCARCVRHATQLLTMSWSARPL